MTARTTIRTVEILAAGSEGVNRHDAMVKAFAERLPQLEDELIATVSSQG